MLHILAAPGWAQSVIANFRPENYADYFSRDSVSLQTALNVLAEVYQVNFIYEDELVKNRNSVVLSKISHSFYRDLDRVLAGLPIQYIKAGKKTIVLILKEKETAVHREIRGRVISSHGHPLPDVEVFIPGTSWGSVTERDGTYCIQHVPEGRYTVTARHVGYRTLRREIEIREREVKPVDFSLEPDVLSMGEVITTASRNRVTKLASSVAVSTANSQEIRERKPYSTAELLQFIPGFYVESSGGESGNNLFPRGIPQDGSYRYVAMFEDGLPIYEAPELAFTNIDILMRLDENLALMEGVRGGSGSIYASNAPGGIINFISKTGGDRSEGIVKLSVGDYGHYRVDVNAGGPLGKDWRFNAGGFLRRGNGVRSPQFAANNGGQFKANLTRLFENGYARIYLKYLNDRNIFYLPIPLQNRSRPRSVPGLSANYGTLTSIYHDNASLPTPDGGTLHRSIRDGIHPETMSATAELGFDLGKGWSVNNRTRWTHADVQFNAIFSLDNPFPAAVFADSVKGLSAVPGVVRWEYRYADSGEPVPDIATLNGNGLVARSGWWSVSKPLRNVVNQLQIQKEFATHSLNLTGYLSRYSAGDFWYWQNVLSEVRDAPRLLDLVGLDEEGNERARVTENGFEQYGTFYVNAQNEARVTALAVVDEWQPWESLRLDVGWRWEHSRFEGRVENTRSDFAIPGNTAWAAQQVMYGTGTFREYRHTFEEWALTMGANYSITRNFAIYGRGSRGFRTPDFEQWLFSLERGNSQYVQQFEGGIKLAAEQVSLFGTVFYSRLDNIPFEDEVFRYGRIVKERRFAKSTTVGTELEVAWTIIPPLQLQVISTLQNPRLRDFQAFTIDEQTGSRFLVDLSDNRVRRIPQVLINVRPSYQWDPFKLFADWQYIGPRFVDDANTVELPAYALLSAGLTYELSESGFSISGRVTNLTNSVGLTEGNPRMDQVLANRRDEIFMARPVLGRSILVAAAYSF